MQSMGDLGSKLTGMVKGLGIDIPSDPKPNKRIVCFNNSDGRVCEDLPVNDEVKCNKDGLCSIYFSNIEESNNIEGMATKMGLRTFSRVDNGVGTKTITGVVKKSKLKKIGKILGREIEPIESDLLRSVAKGDIKPPSICKLVPLARSCEPYMTDRTWYYMGPLAGWVRANNFREALKVVRGKVKSPIIAPSGAIISKNASSQKRILTTL